MEEKKKNKFAEATGFVEGNLSNHVSNILHGVLKGRLVRKNRVHFLRN